MRHAAMATSIATAKTTISANFEMCLMVIPIFDEDS
jgi:hypothetical protein